MKKLFLLCVLMLLCLSFAQAYYADIVIDVNEAGVVSISGVTNHPTLLVENSAEFTSKESQYWVLNISTDGVYEDLVYEINLPKGSIINYMKVPNFGNIQEDSGIILSGGASNTLLDVTVQYKIQSQLKKNFPFWLIIVLAFIILMILYMVRSLKNNVSKKIDYTMYSQRQVKILKFLAKFDGELTQARLEKLTGFPKSSLSRNIDSLVRKDVVEKFNKGMSNSIRLKEKKEDNS